MPFESDPEMGINSWFEDEIHQQYLLDRTAVDESWRQVFERTGGEAPALAPVGQALPTAKPAADAPPPRGVHPQPLRGAAGRLAENMSASVAIPLATSQRTITVKVMDENRRIVNQHRTLLGRGKG